MSDVSMDAKKFSARYVKLQAKLIAYQHKRAGLLAKSRMFLKEVKDFRYKFLKDGFPPQGLMNTERRHRWMASLAQDKREQFELKLKRFVITVLVKLAYSEKWTTFVENYVLYNQTTNPPATDCDCTWDLPDGSDLWRFNITGLNAIPSHAELSLIKLRLDREFESRRGEYYTKTDLITQLLKQMDGEKESQKIKGYGLFTSYKQLRHFLKSVHGIQVSEEYLRMLNSRNASKSRKKS